MTLPIVDPPDDPPGPEASVAGVLLAAGESRRFGEANKLLVEVDGVPMVRHTAETLIESSVGSVTVVVGHEADRIHEALGGLDVEFVENPNYRDGQASSVGAGIEAVGDVAGGRVDAVVFALGDMPEVDPASVDALIDAYRDGAGDALAAAFEGERGNPVLFDARHFDDLADVDGDVGGREILLDGDASALVETGDSGVRRDVDVRDDLGDE